MLSVEDNELLSRVGPGTAMGDLMRQYWMPAIRSDELPAPDCPPLRVKLLGEELIAFRTTSGEVGLMQNACPHRGASMFFGRNEEEGLRCVYHGWKFDVTGACVDMPSEPAESNFKNKVHAKAYPTQERNGVIWAYMGPREVRRRCPTSRPTCSPRAARDVHIYIQSQLDAGLGGRDGHRPRGLPAWRRSRRVQTLEPGIFGVLPGEQRGATFQVSTRSWAPSYGAYRPAEEDTYYWRIAHQLFPFYAMVPTGAGPEASAFAPTCRWTTTTRWSGPSTPHKNTRAEAPRGRRRPAQPAQLLPTTTDWLGRFQFTQNLANDFLVDRELQKSGESYSGIRGIRQQDMAVTGSMGPIYDRSHEHLGTTDALIIRTRRRVIAAAKALRDEGIIPPGVDDPNIYAQRSGGVILPRNVDWWEGTQDLRRAFVDRSAMAEMARLGNA